MLGLRYLFIYEGEVALYLLGIYFPIYIVNISILKICAYKIFNLHSAIE